MQIWSCHSFLKIRSIASCPSQEKNFNAFAWSEPCTCCRHSFCYSCIKLPAVSQTCHDFSHSLAWLSPLPYKLETVQKQSFKCIGTWLEPLSFWDFSHLCAQKLNGKDLSEFERFLYWSLNIIDYNPPFNQRILCKSLWTKLIKINLCWLVYIFSFKISPLSNVKHSSIVHSTGKEIFNLLSVGGFSIYYSIKFYLLGSWILVSSP